MVPISPHGAVQALVEDAHPNHVPHPERLVVGWDVTDEELGHVVFSKRRRNDIGTNQVLKDVAMMVASNRSLVELGVMDVGLDGLDDVSITDGLKGLLLGFDEEINGVLVRDLGDAAAAVGVDGIVKSGDGGKLAGRDGGDLEGAEEADDTFEVAHVATGEEGEVEAKDNVV